MNAISNMNDISVAYGNNVKIIDNRIVKYTDSKITKFWILVKHTDSSNYECMVHPFMMNINSERLVGQFISSTWYNERVSVHKPHTIYIVESDYKNSYEQITNDFNENIHQNNWGSFYNVYKFTFMPSTMKELVNSMASQQTHHRGPTNKIMLSSVCNTAQIEFSVNLYYDSNNTIVVDNHEFPKMDKNFIIMSTPTIYTKM